MDTAYTLETMPIGEAEPEWPGAQKIGVAGVWWSKPRDGEPNPVWAEDGGLALGRVATLDDAKARVLAYEQLSLLPCSGCGTTIAKDDVQLQHFAGRFGACCAEKYRQEHARRCRTCGQPEYRCTC